MESSAKRLVLVTTLLTIVTLSPTSGQTKNSNKQAGDAEQTLRRIEQEMVDSLKKGDASVPERYLAETYVFTDVDGTVMDKSRSVGDIKSGALKAPSVKLEDIRVQIYGDAAVVTLRSIEKGTSYKGKDLSGQYRWTDVFVRRNGNWQMVASQATPIRKP
jgi:ketosteroid isomerase-like protein